MKHLVETLPKDYLKTIFWKAPNPIGISTAKEGLYVDVNEAFLKYAGMRREEIVGKTSIELGIITKRKRSKMLNEIKEKGHSKEWSLKLRTANNELSCFSINTVPIKIKNQVLLLSVVADISRIKLAKDAQRVDVLMKSFDCIDETGVILIGNDTSKQSSIFYMNDTAKKALETKPLQELLNEIEKNKTICISSKIGFYHVKTISTLRSSPLKIILMEPFPEVDLLKDEMKNHGLTSRQREITLLAATGHSNNEIAEKLFITEYTVKDHMKNIFQILDVHNRSELCPKILNLR